MGRKKPLYKQMSARLHEYKVNAHKSDKSRGELKREIGHVQHEFTWSDKTHEAAQRGIKQFTKYVNNHRPDLKKINIDDVKREDIIEYLRFRQDVLGRKPETVSQDMWALNKVFALDLTKSEVELRKVYKEQVSNNRDRQGTKMQYDDYSEKQQKLLDVSRAFGLRRNEYKDFTDKSLFKDKKGDVYVYLSPSTKGGKVRTALCTDEMKPEIERRFGEHIRPINDVRELPKTVKGWREITEGGKNLERRTFSHSVSIHRLGRQHYAQQLLRELEEKDVKFPNDYLDKQNRTKTNISTYTTNNIVMDRNHAQFISKNLGHNRIDVLSRYIM